MSVLNPYHSKDEVFSLSGDFINAHRSPADCNSSNYTSLRLPLAIAVSHTQTYTERCTPRDPHKETRAETHRHTHIERERRTHTEIQRETHALDGRKVPCR